MKKIVIKTDCPEADNVLIACIRMLFPEREVQTLPVRTKSFKDVSMALELATAHKQKSLWQKSRT